MIPEAFGFSFFLRVFVTSITGMIELTEINKIHHVHDTRGFL